MANPVKSLSEVNMEAPHYSAKLERFGESGKFFMSDAEKSREELLQDNAALRERLKQAHRSMHHLGRELSHIQHILQAVNSTLDLDEVVERVMDALGDVFDFDQISIYLYNSQTHCLEITDWYGEASNDELMKNFQNYPLSIEWEEVYFIKAFLDNEPKYVSPIDEGLLKFYCARDRQMFEWNPHHAICIFPLEVQEKVIGVINFVNTHKPFDLDEEAILRVQGYVAHIASTINNAYLARKNQYALALSRNKEREAAHLNQVILTTNATLDFDSVFIAIREGLQEIFEFEAVGIQLVSHERGQTRLNVYKVYGDDMLQEHVETYRKINISIEQKNSVSSWVYHNRELFYFPRIADPEALSPTDRAFYDVVPFSAYLALPLLVQNRVIGVISFFRTQGAYTLDEAGIERIRRYVAALSSAINNANLYRLLKKSDASRDALVNTVEQYLQGEASRKTLESLVRQTRSHSD